MSDITPAQKILKSGPLQGYQIDGVVTSGYFCPPHHLKVVKEMTLQPLDVLVTGFPKSGKSLQYLQHNSEYRDRDSFHQVNHYNTYNITVNTGTGIPFIW